MDISHPTSTERTRLLSGIKTAALIVIIGAVAVAADQALFLGGKPGAPEAAPEPAALSPVQTDGLALPDHLRRPTAADTETAAPTF